MPRSLRAGCRTSTRPTARRLSAIDIALAPELIERFAAEAAPLWPEGATLGVAISGGADSTALLLLAHAARPGQVEAATVDHGIRPESAGEAKAVARLCDRLGIEHRTLPVTLEQGNVQSEARRVRYAALAEWMQARQIGPLATAHHVDDQAETLLMRLNRGSGVAGLAGVRASGPVPGFPDLTVIRPVLGWRRAELAEVVSSAGIRPVHDPSNDDLRFDRVRVRLALGEAEWLDSAAMAASAAHLAEADDALEWLAAREWETQVDQDIEGIMYTPDAPRAIRLRVLTRAIADLGGEARGGSASRLLDMLEAGGGGNVAGVLATATGGGWLLRREPPRTQ